MARSIGTAESALPQKRRDNFRSLRGVTHVGDSVEPVFCFHAFQKFTSNFVSNIGL
jgi:hypothetical protein